MLASIIAAASALVGVALSTVLQQRQAREVRAEARSEQTWRDILQAVTELVARLADHRRAMWVREEARLTGASEQEVAALRAESHVTRSAITAPHMTLTILAPALAEAADDAVAATYDMRGATAMPALELLRESAVAATNRFAAAARAALATR
ncbi:protein kilB [Streptomyces sp. NPDC058322]|uniref:protein kilB n=1 Tax=Streptomyces sp. NPDC058322 TaxID=3346446 RepID=UPI0036EA1925